MYSFFGAPAGPAYAAAKIGYPLVDENRWPSRLPDYIRVNAIALGAAAKPVSAPELRKNFGSALGPSSKMGL
jgi:hypothetical protein